MSDLVIFEEVNLRNFRLHEELDFSFIPSRFVSITGANGSGKTTIISGLCWALYDVTADGIKGDEVVRHRSGKDTSVKLVWSRGEDRYTLTAHRKHHKYKNRRILLKNDIDISCNTEAETLALIEDLVMPKDVFMNCLLFSQFVKNSFTDLTYAGQRAIIDQMLLLKCYDDYSENTTNLIRQANGVLTVTNSKISSADSDCETKEQMIAREEVNHVETIQTLNDQLNAAREQFQQLKCQYNNLNETELKKQQEELNRSIIELSGKVSSLESQLATQRELCGADLKESRTKIDSDTNAELSKVEKKYGQRIADVKDSVHKLENEISSYEKEKSDVTAQLEQRLSDIKSQKKEQLEKIIFPVTEEKQATNISILKLDDELSESTRKLKKYTEEKVECDSGLHSDNPNCPTCGQDLQTKSALEKIQILSKQLEDNITELSSKIKSKEEEITSLNDKFEKLQIQVDKINAEYEEDIQRTNELAEKKRHEIITTCNQKVAKVQVTLDKLKTQVEQDEQSYEKEKEVIISNCEQLKISKDKEIKQKHRSIAQQWIDDLVNLKETQESASKKLEKTNELISEINTIKSSIASVESRIEELTNSINRTMIEHTTRVKVLREDIDSIKENLIKYQDDVTALERRLRILEFWKKGFSDTGIKAILLDETVPILNERARELCAMVPMLRVRFDSQTQLKSGENRNKFAIEVLHTRNLSSRKELSAGEKRMTDIIVLMCLRHLLERIQNTKINILLLDEILDSLDPENAAIAVGMAKELSNDHCVVLISHTLRDFIEADESLQM